jgi:hypothetical protein
MAYRIRIILDVPSDVIRDIIIDENSNLEAFHFTIAKSFGFKGQEMASFFRTNNDWDQGEEIPLFNMSDDSTTQTMQNTALKDVFINKGDKLIYVYDFLALWTFFVEFIKVVDADEKQLPKTIFQFGNTPDKAPEKEFIAENDLDSFNELGEIDDFNENSDFDNIDDFDF